MIQLGDKNIWNEDKIWAILTPGLPQALADNEGRKGPQCNILFLLHIL